MLCIGLDFGTSGCRATVLDAELRVCGEARVGLAPPRRHGPRVEQSADLWWGGLCALMQALGAQIPLARVAAVAVDGTSGTLLLSDGDGNPLTPALMYNDTRSSAEAARLSALAPADSAAHGAGSSLAKLLHLYRGAPEARHALHQADWISARLCGRCGVSDENNALKLGYDPRQRVWPDWLGRLDFPRELLPSVVPPGTAIGRICDDAARQCGLSGHCRVVAGTTDSTAAAIASGISAPGDALTSLGSTLVLKVLSPAPVVAPRYGVYSHRLGDLWLAGGASNSGGAVLRRYFDDRTLDRLSAELDPERPSGLDYYPLPAPGERFPVSDPALVPRLSPRPRSDALFLQGLLESMAAIEARGYALLAELGAPYPSRVYSGGGGAHNPAWARIRARLLARPVLPAARVQASYGAAVLALRAMGVAVTNIVPGGTPEAAKDESGRTHPAG